MQIFTQQSKSIYGDYSIQLYDFLFVVVNFSLAFCVPFARILIMDIA